MFVYIYIILCVSYSGCGSGVSKEIKDTLDGSEEERHTKGEGERQLDTASGIENVPKEKPKHNDTHFQHECEEAHEKPEDLLVFVVLYYRSQVTAHNNIHKWFSPHSH